MADTESPTPFHQNQLSLPAYEVLVLIEQPFEGQDQLSQTDFLTGSHQVVNVLHNQSDVSQIIPFSQGNNEHVSESFNNFTCQNSSKLPETICIKRVQETTSTSRVQDTTHAGSKCITRIIKTYQPSGKEDIKQGRLENNLKSNGEDTSFKHLTDTSLPGGSTDKGGNILLEGPLQLNDPPKLSLYEQGRLLKLTTKSFKPRPRAATQPRNVETGDAKPASVLNSPLADVFSSAGLVDYVHCRSSFPLENKIKTPLSVNKIPISFEISPLITDQHASLYKTANSLTAPKPKFEAVDQQPQAASTGPVPTQCSSRNSTDRPTAKSLTEEKGRKSKEEMTANENTKIMEDLSCNFKWLFSEDQLQNTPSVESGINLEQELTFRQKQAMLIQTIGLKSGLTQLAVNTSVIFMHRFYMFRTVQAFPRIHLAIGFAFAGGKVEESARKLEHLIRTAVEIIRSNKNREFLDKNDPLTYNMDCEWRAKMEILSQSNCNIESTAYQEMRKYVLECETEIYAVIGFQLQIVHPHNYVIRMCALLGAENIKDISQYAYNLATASSQLTMLCLKYKPETIATMCLNIASKAHSVKFVSMKDPNVKWYQVLHSQTDITEIEAVSEEFLNLIKGCPLLPSWMTNLSRMSRAANNRALTASRSSAPVPPVPRSVSSSGAVASGIITHLSSSSSTATQPARPSQQTGIVETPQLTHPGQDAASSPNGKGTTVSDSAVIIGAAAPIGLKKDSSHSRSQVGSSSQMKPPTLSSTSVQPNPNHQQHHRTHAIVRSQNTTTLVSSGNSSSSNKPQSRHPSTAGAITAPGTKPSNQHHIPSHPSSHPASTRLATDISRHSTETMKPYELNRSQESSRPLDPSRNNHELRPKDQLRVQDTGRHIQQRPEGQVEIISKSQLTREESIALRHQQAKSAADFISAQESTEQPFCSSPPVSQSSPESAASVNLEMVKAPSYPTPPEQKLKNIESNSQLQQQAPKLSLSMYRERAAKTKAASESLTMNEEITHMNENPYDTLLDSPVHENLKSNIPNSELGNQPIDSPNAPSLKIKVKLDPSGERHYVKNPESGLKLKIKPLKSDTLVGIDGDFPASGSKMSSRSNTPFEEGEIIDESSPALSTGERKSEGLKIRLSVPRSGDSSSSYSRRESDHNSNGHERDSHRSHHHSHQHRSHHHKSKKHSSKHDRSRHESKSSKRSAPDYLDERASKTLRLETSESGRHSSHHDNSSSQVLQHQNSGFSINDAFSSTLPSNIFDDDDDDGSHAHPPITPPPETLYGHDKLNPRMSRHKLEYKRPPLPKGLPPPSPPPPPPSPPTL